jgi:hypothetical protein
MLSAVDFNGQYSMARYSEVEAATAERRDGASGVFRGAVLGHLIIRSNRTLQ